VWRVSVYREVRDRQRARAAVAQVSDATSGTFWDRLSRLFVASSWNAFYIAQRGPGHGIAVRYGNELDLAFAAGAIIDQNRGPVSHVQRLLFDDDLRSAHPARGKYGS